MLIRSALGAADKRRIQAMLFANNGGDLRQQLLDGSPLNLSNLTHSLIPVRGDVTPSFTRATTETGQKWDEAGYLDFTALAGEIVWKGARRVRNHFAATEALDGASWAKSGATVTASAELDPDGETRAFRVQLAGGGLTYVGQSLAFAIGSVTLPAFYVKSNTAGDQTFRIIADGGIFNSADFTATQEWQAFKLPVSATTQANDIYGIREGSGGAAADILVALPRCNDVTGETDQTTLRPYVSVGVPADWAGDELVTNGTFDTDTTWTKEIGWTIGGGAAIAATASATLYQTDTLAIGTKYVASFSVSSVSAGSVSIRIGAAPLVPYDFKTAAGTYSVEFVADAVSTLVGVIGVGFTGTVDNISVKPAIYHGSMVDGVKCYDTDRSGNPISTSGSYPLVGYVPWEARTNLCLQSNAFTTTWLTTGTPAATQNAIGPDGATSAWTLTDNAAGALEGVFMPAASLTLTAETWTASIFVGKTSGAQASYPVVSLDSSGVIAICTIDTSNGVATAWTAYTALTIATGLTARCRSFNDDFWRVEISFTATAAGWTFALYPAGTTNATQSTGVVAAAAVGSAVFYGAQVELGSFATPYIPTTTAAVARNADILTYTGADVALLKTLAATFSRGVGVSNVGVVAALSDNTLNEYSAITLQSATSCRIEGVDGGVLQWAQTASNAYSPGATSKAAYSFATNDIKADKDGTGMTADAAATIPTVTQLQVGHLAGLYQLNGPVNHIYGWTRNLSQSELGAIDA